MIKTTISRKKRMRNMLIVSFIIFIGLLTRIGWIQFVQGDELQAMAYTQQTLDRNINPKRGTIYDRSGTVILAESASVETVTVNPTNIKGADKEKVAKILSDLFALDYEKTLKKVSKKTSIETIARKIEKEKANMLREWMKENNINKGINVDEDTKRYYPYQKLASQIIGFCGSDNQGLDGIEAKYDTVLKGTMGKIQRQADATGDSLKYEGENYVPAVNGKDLILTIDMTVQAIAEKYLENACIDNKCTDGGNIIIIQPKTGDVLAMATYPNYNLNSPYDAPTEELESIWNDLSSNEQTKELQKVWRNKAIADTYEPGSTFKLVTSSAALEEKIAEVDKEGAYHCSGRIEVAGVKIRCWRYYRPHGSQSLRQALMNSCNPVFIGLGQKLGVETYYNYLERFKLLKRTGIDLYGEAASIFLDKKKVGPVELATIAFGQRFEVTPIQMVRMASTVANGGEVMQPRIVKAMVDSSTGEKEEIQPVNLGRAISEDTAKGVLSMMESVVAEGTGKSASVKGYRIGGKTGTSEDGVNTNKFIASFIGIAPIEDPEIAMLITLYNPTGEGGHQGGGIAAPLAGQILGEVLPYLEVQKGKTEEMEEEITTSVPDIRNLTIKEAKKQLKEKNLEIELPTEDINTEETIVTEQTPKPGITVKEGSKIKIEI